ncbi:MAG: ParB N-terminal domain-containing protein [Candidatus Sulfotelmatobacter sp.]
MSTDQLQEFKLKDVLPNPFRDVARFPLNKEKLEALEESIRATGFWNNILGRKRSDGKLEIAYGHHRLAALKKLEILSAVFIVRQLSDEQMLAIMQAENDERYSHDFCSVIEAVRSAVLKVASGELHISVPLDTPKKRIRYAPSFVAGKEPMPDSVPYTAKEIARLLASLQKDGEPKKKIIVALDVLELEERQVWFDPATNKPMEFTAENLYRLFGRASVSVVENMTKDIRKRHDTWVAITTAKAEEARRKHETLKERAQRARAEEEAIKAENERLIDERLKATEAEERAKAEEFKKQIAEGRQRKLEAEAKRKIAEKEFEAWKKTDAKVKETERRALRQRMQEAEARRASRVKTAVDEIERRFTERDPIYENYKIEMSDCRTNDAEKKKLRDAMKDLQYRVSQVRK